MIFILGGDGFIGTNVYNCCVNRGYQTQRITRQNYSQYVGKHCDIFINANGNSKKYMADDDPQWEFEASVVSVHKSLTDFAYDKYVYISSCDVYPSCDAESDTAEKADIDIEHESNYGFHKYLAEQCVRHFAPNWLIFRMGGFVGPGLKKNPVYDILNDIPLRLHEESELQFIDVCRAANVVLDCSCNMNITKECFNLTAKRPASLRLCAEILGKHAEHTSDIVKKYYLDVSKIEQYFQMPDTEDEIREFCSALRK